MHGLERRARSGSALSTLAVDGTPTSGETKATRATSTHSRLKYCTSPQVSLALIAAEKNLATTRSAFSTRDTVALCLVKGITAASLALHLTAVVFGYPDLLERTILLRHQTCGALLRTAMEDGKIIVNYEILQRLVAWLTIASAQSILARLTLE
jgi:hypothetical protein